MAEQETPRKGDKVREGDQVRATDDHMLLVVQGIADRDSDESGNVWIRGHGCASGTIEILERGEDPSSDPTGTTYRHRVSERVAVKMGPNAYATMGTGTDVGPDLLPCLYGHAGWVRTGTVPGTPAAQVQQTPPSRCSAHGKEKCPTCSRTKLGGLTDDLRRHCTQCSAYENDGMHWDTCPNRITTPVVEPLVLEAGAEEPDRSKKFLDREGDTWLWDDTIQRWRIAKKTSDGNAYPREWADMRHWWFPLIEVVNGD